MFALAANSVIRLRIVGVHGDRLTPGLVASASFVRSSNLEGNLAMTPRFVAGVVFATVLVGGSAQADFPPLKSGPPVGAGNNRSGFRPQFVTGPGKRRCPV